MLGPNCPIFWLPVRNSNSGPVMKLQKTVWTKWWQLTVVYVVWFILSGYQMVLNSNVRSFEYLTSQYLDLYCNTNSYFYTATTSLNFTIWTSGSPLIKMIYYCLDMDHCSLRNFWRCCYLLGMNITLPLVLTSFVSLIPGLNSGSFHSVPVHPTWQRSKCCPRAGFLHNAQFHIFK
jgi:hypothetical protein